MYSKFQGNKEQVTKTAKERWLVIITSSLLLYPLFYCIVNKQNFNPLSERKPKFSIYNMFWNHM